MVFALDGNGLPRLISIGNTSRGKNHFFGLWCAPSVSMRYDMLNILLDILFYEQILYAVFTHWHVSSSQISSKTMLRTL